VTDCDILDRYPTLFDLSGDVTKTLLMFGFEGVGPGWLKIIDLMCAELAPCAPVGFAIICVKEKYGSLRVIYRGGDDRVEAIVEAAKSEAQGSYHCGNFDF
jgi:hypothetical protein